MTPTEATFTELHARFSVVQHSFSSKNEAAEVAGRLRRMMDRRFERFNPLAIEVFGTKGAYLIQFPRLNDFWSPRDLTVRGIAEEVTRIANEFDTIYDRKVIQ